MVLSLPCTKVAATVGLEEKGSLWKKECDQDDNNNDNNDKGNNDN